MAGLIERKAKTEITIKQPTGTFVDGKPQRGEYPAKCMFFDASQEDRDYFGETQNNTVYLIAPFEVVLKRGSQIVHGENTYDAPKIKTIRNTDGVILGYKVAV